MIIFDLDGTLADCEHRRHLVDASKNPEHELRKNPTLHECVNNLYIPAEYILKGSSCKDCVNENFTKFQPQWKTFYEACDKDTAIWPVINILKHVFNDDICEIWSGRCESVREKTLDWLCNYIQADLDDRKFLSTILKMRPIGDSTPEYRLKEKWYDLHNIEHPRNNVDFVFESEPESIKMWRRRGVFVFDVNQKNF